MPRKQGEGQQGIRLVRILMRIQEPKVVRTVDLAVEFGITMRTVRRDIYALRAALAPLGKRVTFFGTSIKITQQ